MDNAFTQVLIQEIEMLNLRYSQYSLLFDKAKKEAEGKKDYKPPEDIVKLTQQFIDELKISITQISIRIPPIKDKIKLSEEAESRLTELTENLRTSKIPDEKELFEYVTLINEIYATNLAEIKVESKSQGSQELTS